MKRQHPRKRDRGHKAQKRLEKSRRSVDRSVFQQRQRDDTYLDRQRREGMEYRNEEDRRQRKEWEEHRHAFHRACNEVSRITEEQRRGSEPTLPIDLGAFVFDDTALAAISQIRGYATIQMIHRDGKTTCQIMDESGVRVVTLTRRNGSC